MKQKIDKAEFIRRVGSQFSFIIESTRKICQMEIEGRQALIDQASFDAWLRSEREKALNDPALQIFHIVHSKSMVTPEDAAQTLAYTMEFDQRARQIFGLEYHAINWEKAFEMAAPILIGKEPNKSENWKYGIGVKQYIQAVKAAEQAKIFTRFIENEASTKIEKKQKSKKPNPEKLLPGFEQAIVDPSGLPDIWLRMSAMERPFVNEQGRFIGNKKGRNVVKVLAFSQSVSGLMKPGISQFDTYIMLCVYWDLPISSRPAKALDQAAYLPTLTEIKDLLK